MKTCISRPSAWKLSFAVAALAVLCCSDAARACSTPVYRYAMYNWPSAPYRVFHFHRGEPAEGDKAVNAAIDELGEDRDAPANIFIDSINLTETELEKLPKPVKEALEAHEDGEPAHLVFTPWGVNIFSGRLDKETLKAMSESPARTRIAELLEEGSITVLLFVPGKDNEETARVEKEIKEVIRRGASGEIPIDAAFAFPPMPGPDGEQPDEDAMAEAAKTKITTLKVNRSDEAEQWLIRSLMTIEPDLPELADEPMVFAVYGRGRALEPYIGKGIDADNLTDVVMFLGSSCSCTVKGMNPGADLLVKWNWDATADVLAADDPSFDMSPYGYSEYSVGDMEEPAAEAVDEPEADDEAVAEAAAVDEPEVMADAGAVVVAAEGAVAAPPTEEPEAEPSEPEPVEQPEPSPVADAAGPPPSAPTDSFASRQLLTYGLGLAAAAAVVLGIGFVLIRRQSAP